MPDYIYSYDWYDGPRSGVASYNGHPYYFESQWVDVYQPEEDWFKLTPVTNEVFEQELEYWELWGNYAAAFHAGLVGSEHHPFLPADRLRGEELRQLLKGHLVIDEANYLIARAKFAALDKLAQQANRAEMAVLWEILPLPPNASYKPE